MRQLPTEEAAGLENTPRSPRPMIFTSLRGPLRGAIVDTSPPTEPGGSQGARPGGATEPHWSLSGFAVSKTPPAGAVGFDGRPASAFLSPVGFGHHHGP